MFANISETQKNIIHIIGYFIIIFAMIIFATRIVAPQKNNIWIIIGILLGITFVFFLLTLIFIKDLNLEKIFWLIFNFFTFVIISALLFSIYYESIQYCFNYDSIKDFKPIGYFLIILAILCLIGLKILIRAINKKSN
jgi:hypothetical protein